MFIFFLTKIFKFNLHSQDCFVHERLMMEHGLSLVEKSVDSYLSNDKGDKMHLLPR